MRRPIGVVLAVCLLGLSAGPAVVAQSPSPDSVGVGKRVEVPEMGFAATFPEGWIVESQPSGEAHVVSPDGSTECLPTGERVDEPIDDPAAALDQVAVIFPNFSDDGPAPIIETSEIELPAGRAIRFVLDQALIPNSVEEGYARYTTYYILINDFGLLFFLCWDPERPDDDWLSIAETIEFLPAEE